MMICCGYYQLFSAYLCEIGSKVSLKEKLREKGEQTVPKMKVGAHFFVRILKYFLIFFFCARKA